MEHSLIDLDKVKQNKIYDLLICSFIDILRISAPEIPLENDAMEFYLEMLIKWLMLEDHINSKSDLQQTTFFYILHQIAKLSALCLLFTTRLIDQVPLVINKLFFFLEKKLYNQQQYQDFLECISSTVNEYSEVPNQVLQILLSNLCKDKKDNLEKQAFDVAFNVIKENKSILGNKIRDYIKPQLHNLKNKKGKKKLTDKKKKSLKSENSFIEGSNSDIISFFENNNYLKIIKELSKISPDFLLKLLGDLNDEGLNISKKYFSYSSFDILRKILSNENSYEIFQNWVILCNNYFNSMKEINIDDDEKEQNIFNIKFYIFKSAIKFLTRNDKDKLKEIKAYTFVRDAISFFLKSLSAKSDIEKCLKVLIKTSNWNITSFCLLILLSSKNNKKKKLIEDFYFEIIKEHILSNLIFQDFKDKKITKSLNTLSKPFNLILSSLDESVKLYQLNIDINNKIEFNYFLKKIQNIFEAESTFTTVKLMLFFYMAAYTREATTIWYTILHMIFTDKEINEEDKKKEGEEEIVFLNIFDFKSENNSKKSKNNEIKGLIDFFNQYIIFVDEKSNPDSIKVLISILFTLEMFLCSIHYGKDSLSENNKDLLYIILNQVIKVIFNNNIINKNVFDVICKIILLLFHLLVNLGNDEKDDIKIKQKLNELLFIDMADFVFKNDKINPKYYVKLVISYYQMIENLYVKDTNEIFRIFPKNFSELLKIERKINCLSFVNELIFYNIDNKYLSFYFDPNLATNIMHLIEIANNEEIENGKNEICEIIGKEQENKENNNNDMEIEELTSKLLPKIKFSTEIIKYELNYFLKKMINNINNEDNNKYEDESNFEIKKYIKTIFNNIFKLINTVLINKKFLLNDNNSTKKKMSEIYLEDKDKDKKIKIKKNKKNKNKDKNNEEKEKESKKMKKDLKISNLEDIININYIERYIDLLFYMSEISIAFSFRKIIKISNLMLVRDIRIRNYFISKINKSLIKIRKSHRNLTRLYSIMLLGLSDPNEKIEKKCKEILGIFLDLLKIKILKYENYLNSDGYIYIPEVYILYLIIFFIFNDNINVYYQQNLIINNNKYQSNKYFMNIFGTYLKEIKKKFGFVDSTFLLKVLNEMKKLDCKNIKKIKCLDKENVFLNYDFNTEIENNNDESDDKDKISVDFNKVKNSIIDNIMSMIYSDFLSDKKRTDNNGNGIQPQIPNILTGKDKEFKDNYLYNFNKYHNKNNTQSQENNNEANKESKNNSNILNSSKKVKENFNYKDKKKFSFNEYFKEENEDENY